MRRPSPSLIIATVALFFSLGGVGLAANHYLLTSTRQIKPSVIRALRSAPGPQGLPGAQGAQGATGVTAPLEQTEDVAGNPNVPTSVPAGQSMTVHVFCPGGAQAEGGGYQADGMTVDGSWPDPPNGWQISVTNNTGATQQVIPWVTCRGTAATLAG